MSPEQLKQTIETELRMIETSPEYYGSREQIKTEIQISELTDTEMDYQESIEEYYTRLINA